ncbi:hypothetical protein [Bacillus thuringiensis]|uniref:hypothetical protein n=1 Tax=Bacillus thuringiensis TaxID=1428 RepID=UPI0021B4358B|nr:hypothetical protein [Bacillus thuringiensis]
MWDFNQLVIAIIDKHGIEAGEAILEDLQQHATDTATLHIQALESEKVLYNIGPLTKTLLECAHTRYRSSMYQLPSFIV